MTLVQMRVETHVKRTPRVQQVEAMFDAPADDLHREWQIDVPLDDKPWQVGLIVGPSGAGKSTLARKIFGEHALERPDWPADTALVDVFGDAVGIRDVTTLLSSVGLASPPVWVRPYSTLSTGEQFRADVARALSEHPDIAVIDEWTSTVDRQVAQVASHTAAKTVRRRGGQLVAVTCHYDVVDWLQPDWVLQPHTGDFAWRSVQPRPRVEFDICEIDRSAWRAFSPHHYLTAKLPSGGQAWGAFVAGECVAFAHVGHFPHPSPKTHNLRRVNRLVTLPDWQGLGIGPALMESVADIYHHQGYRVRALMAHPGLIHSCEASPRWIGDKRPIGARSTGNKGQMGKRNASVRLEMVRGFTYTPPAPSSTPH